jgi:predicted ATPase/DNA-binding CsgD family transcriptional regulator
MKPSPISSDLPGNLPLPLNTFVGRRQEITAVKGLLLQHRLITLTGTGGCGKTRLAMRVARDVQAAYGHGTWLFEFASLQEKALVPQLVASILGLHEQARNPIEQSLVAYLQNRHLLLIFDNCEHLLLACANLAQVLLENCPRIQILTTSREPLGLPGEALWVVPPLTLPEQKPWSGPANEKDLLSIYGRADAVQLFVERARTTSPQFRLTAENGAWLSKICHRLDGIPLAIELAAAHLRYLSPRQIAERLDDRFQLLTSTLRTAPERHQTLEAALDWSYALLTETQKQTINRLSVFANGWTLDAAAAVCALPKSDPPDTFNDLLRLVDKSLVIVRPANGENRHHLLETVRHYAAQKLAQEGEEVEKRTRNRHLDYFVQWAEAGAPYLMGRQQTKWLEKFENEHDNLRAAIEWSHSAERGQEGLRLTAACSRFWSFRSYYSEGRTRLTAALATSSGQARTRTRALALIGSANLAYLQSDYEATRVLAEEGLSIGNDLGLVGRADVAWALDLLGEVATELGDYETADSLLREALRIYEALGDARGKADMNLQLGWAAMREGDYYRAEIRLQQALQLTRDLGDLTLLGLSLGGLGELKVRQGRHEEALVLLEESLATRRELGNLWGIGTSLGTMGWVALLQRDFKGMRRLLGQSLEVRLEIGDQGGIAWCLEKLAEAAFLEAETLPADHRRRLRERSARILGKASELREQVNSVIDYPDIAAYERIVSKLQRTLGETAFRATWEEGRLSPLREVIESAQAPALTEDQAAALLETGDDSTLYGGLSPRERETAVLIAEGKSNREIAEAMTIQTKTVETYVTRILNKLGFDSRVQIATWVLQIGLAESHADNP